jgi:DNA (cytosine-5)-methyltransferase 1
VENVADLFIRGLDRVLGNLATLGYDAEWHCIPASYAGLRQLRDRVWIVAYPNGSGISGRPIVTEGWRLQSRAEQLERLVQPSAWPTVSSARDDGTGHGVPQRMERLHALGNAVVPQIPEMIGRAIMATRLDA